MAARQFLLKIGAGHARHGHVQHQTPGLPEAVGSEELLRRREGFGRVAALPQQVGQRLAHGLVVVDDRYKWAYKHHEPPLARPASESGGVGATPRPGAAVAAPDA